MATSVAIVVVIVIIVAAGAGYFVLSSTGSSTTSPYSSIESSSSSLTTMASSDSTFSSTQSSASFSCPTSAFGNLTGVTGSSSYGPSSLSYNPVELFGNFSSMSIRVSESTNGTLAFSDNSSYTVLGSPTINGTRFVEVNFSVSLGMAAYGITNVSSTAWFAPDGNATKLVQGSITYSDQAATSEANSLAQSFTGVLSIGKAFTSDFPSIAFSALNQTTIYLGQTQVKVTNYALSQSYVQEIESVCPSVNISSVNLEWQSGVVGQTSLVTYFNFSTATSATSTFGITEQVISLTRAG